MTATGHPTKEFNHPRWTHELISRFRNGQSYCMSHQDKEDLGCSVCRQGFPPRTIDPNYARPGMIETSDLSEAEFHDAIGLR